MRLEFQLIPNLPRLAWSARLQKNEPVVRILHGPWVETRKDCFFEGAWDGPFDDYRFDRALTFVGSGGRLTEHGVVFAGPSHTYDRLYSIRADNEFYISNSLAFVLAVSGERLDSKHPHYFLDFLKHYRNGIRVKQKRLRVAGKTSLELHDCCNLSIQPDLTISRIEKPLGPAPRDYGDYVSFLKRTVETVLANAQDKYRRWTYRPVTMLSQGYDTTAISALAAQAGCREAVSFYRSNGKSGYEDDSGIAIAPYLGLQITEYERTDYEKLLPARDDEFYIEPGGIDRELLLMEKQIAGSILLTGRFGERIWTRERCSRWGLPGDCGNADFEVPVRRKLGGNAIGEFRLKTGFIDFPVPCSGALHGPAIKAITESRAMNAWAIGGSYDRPVARRIAEEAGVPRHLFGQSKKGGPRGRNPERRGWLRRATVSLWLATHWPPLRVLILRVLGNRLHPAWRRGSFAVQRGAEKMTESYSSAIAGGEQQSNAAANFVKFG